jgi:xanthine dehydrogenase accessory factor
MNQDLTVLIKGAGEMASGVACRLFHSGFRLLMTEAPQPLAVRRSVSFCEAVHEGTKSVEGITAVLVEDLALAPAVWEQGRIPLLVDPEMSCLGKLQPDVLLEATLAKRYTGLNIEDAPLVIALGPGFEAGRDAHFVVESNRGHNLGRLYESGRAEANTGIPGEIGGMTWERVLRSPDEGVFETELVLGDIVSAGQEVARVNDEVVLAQIDGILRGLIRPRAMVSQGLKVGDIDPRGEVSHLHTISDKARSLGGAVLEAILRVYNT